MATHDHRDVPRLLLEHWDVLAVAETDAVPESEYLHEAAQVVALLDEGADAAAIADYLESAARGLGVMPNRNRDERASRAVFAAASR